MNFARARLCERTRTGRSWSDPTLKARNLRSAALLRALGLSAEAPPGLCAATNAPDEIVMYKTPVADENWCPAVGSPCHESSTLGFGFEISRSSAHVAIALGSESAVDELPSRLRGRGVTVLDGPRLTGDGCYESVVLDPEGNRIELTV